MIRFILAGVLALALTACAGLDTQSKQAVALCDSYNSKMRDMIQLRKADRLTEGQIRDVGTARHTIGPFCEGDQIADPTTALLSALDAFLRIQLGVAS